MDQTILLLTLAIAAAAALYSSVGHGGASAYIALMALVGLAPEEIRPAALVLNILVAGLGAFRFLRAGRFDISNMQPGETRKVAFNFDVRGQGRFRNVGELGTTEGTLTDQYGNTVAAMGPSAGFIINLGIGGFF